VAVDATTGQMAGLVLSTRLADRTAHIAQLVVDGEARRRGIGEMLTKRAYAAAAGAGCEVMTLMVDEANEPALTLYAGQGFSPRGAFVSGRRPRSVRASGERSAPHQRAG
jgi:ribosomal protein S18 acetylase RimI-like enzyme